MNIKLLLINNCPNIRLLRKYIAQIRVNQLRKRLLNDSIIETAENAPDSKKKIVEECIQKRDRYFVEIKPEIKKAISNNRAEFSGADETAVYDDICFCFFAYGFQPDEYVFYHLKDKNMKERKSYISDLERVIYITQMNDVCDRMLFHDKAKTYEYFRKYYKRDAVRVETKKDYRTFASFVEKHPVFVEKRLDLSRGNGIKLVDISQIEIPVDKYFEQLIGNGKYILEEKIFQSKKMAQLNETSVNTVRCIVIQTRYGVIIPYAFLKVGRKGSFVDNGGKGGILVDINEKNGVLNSEGMDETGKRYNIHPDNGTKFEGFQLPDWQALLELCEVITPLAPSFKTIGWDFAHTDKGWVVVEGNHFGQLVGPQITKGHGIKEEYLNIMKNVDLLAK